VRSGNVRDSFDDSFVAVVVFMDIVVVAMLARRSFEMFASFLGT
jgi:hypothetical protein